MWQCHCDRVYPEIVKSTLIKGCYRRQQLLLGKRFHEVLNQSLTKWNLNNCRDEFALAEWRSIPYSTQLITSAVCSKCIASKSQVIPRFAAVCVWYFCTWFLHHNFRINGSQPFEACEGNQQLKPLPKTWFGFGRCMFYLKYLSSCQTDVIIPDWWGKAGEKCPDNLISAAKLNIYPGKFTTDKPISIEAQGKCCPIDKSYWHDLLQNLRGGIGFDKFTFWSL